MKNKTQLTLLLLFITFFTLSAQIEFVPAYFITNEGEKVECLIKDMEWNMNPTSFDYKDSEASEVKTATLESVKIFEVETSKYERFTVDIDMSRNEVELLSRKKGPEYETKTVFLKYLLEGEKSLLYYKGDGLSKFFVKVNDEVTQLVYKEYLTPAGYVQKYDYYKGKEVYTPGKHAKNELYRGQLLNYLGFDPEMKRRIESASYNEKSLTKLFSYYHNENCIECISYKEDKPRVFYLGIKPGLDVANITTTTESRNTNGLDLGTRINACIGFELEYFLPINKGRYAIFFEPTFFMPDSEKAFVYDSDNSQDADAYADYNLNMIRFPIGIRYYSHLSEYSKFFADFSVSYPLVWDSSIKYYYKNNEASMQPIKFSKINSLYSLGVGCNYKNLAAQVKLNGYNQEFAGNHRTVSVAYNSISFHFAYKFQVFDNLNKR